MPNKKQDDLRDLEEKWKQTLPFIFNVKIFDLCQQSIAGKPASELSQCRYISHHAPALKVPPKVG